jgi:hypothetical protein
MAYFTTGLDLKTDTLALAGEPATGSTYDDHQVYALLTTVERAIISGGAFGPSVLEPMDWFWARAWPRGSLSLVQPFNADQSLSIFTVAGSQQASVLTAIELDDLTGWRLMMPNVAARHIIASIDNSGGGSKTITLQQPWTGETGVTAVWLAYPDTYLLPEDFIRGTSPLILSAFPSNLPTTQMIDVVDPVDLERMFPMTFPWGGNLSAANTGSGLPVLAARVTDRRVRFSHFLNTPATPFPALVEFEYLRRPEVIAEGTIPSVPIQHRRILSYGAAYLIRSDKNSGQAQQIWGMFQAQWKAMRDEQSRDMRRQSSRWGVVQPARSSGNRAYLLTETGLPVYVW